MEHLPQPANPRFPNVDIPFLWGDKYDGAGFLKYPERVGYSATIKQGHHEYKLNEKNEDEHDDEGGGNPETESAFLQQWLFFGLLTEILRTYNVSVDPEDFLRFEDEGVFLTTEKLHEHLEKMRQNSKSFSAEERKTRWTGAMMHFEKAVKFARCAAHADDAHSLTLSEEQALAIAAIGVALQGAVYYISQDIANFDAVPAHVAEAMLGYEAITSRFVRHRLLSSGWCLSDIKLLETYLDPGSAYFASRIDRPGMMKNHNGCSERACVAHEKDVGSGECKPKHIKEDCDCESIQADSQKVTEILQGGGIPAIKIQIDSDGKPTLEVVNSSDHEYVAISHVWHDGLGNSSLNSLPRCQLVRLHGLVRGIRTHGQSGGVEEALRRLEAVSISESRVIWIDTLCVPLEKNANKLALASLHKVYRSATAVLVLDRELQRASARCQWQELCIRIAISRWAKRLASLETGFATKHLLFQFKEKAVEMRRMIQEKRTESDDILRWRFNRTVYRFYSNRVPKHREKPDVTDFVSSGDSLMFRRASRPEFEPLCLAMMMGLDVNNLLDSDSDDERMKRFFIMLEEIPINVLFLLGPKLDIEGFRWIPKSLMDPNSNIRTRWRGPQLTGTAKFDKATNGLSFALPGYTIQLQKGHSEVYFFVRDGEQGKTMFLVDQRRDQSLWSKISDLDEVTLVTESSGQHRGAFLASVEKEGDGVIRARYLFPVEVSPMSDVANAQAMDPDNFKGAMGICSRKLPPSQQWCII